MGESLWESLKGTEMTDVIDFHVCTSISYVKMASTKSASTNQIDQILSPFKCVLRIVAPLCDNQF